MAADWILPESDSLPNRVGKTSLQSIGRGTWCPKHPRGRGTPHLRGAGGSRRAMGRAPRKFPLLEIIEWGALHPAMRVRGGFREYGPLAKTDLQIHFRLHTCKYLNDASSL